MMGREIRRVPPNWKHPKRTCCHIPNCENYECYQPLYDETYEVSAQEWIGEFEKWQRGERPDYFSEGDSEYYWDWNGKPPNKLFYRDYKDEDATWYQVYETVSEGTPVTPPFETEDELIDYLVINGDFWYQKDQIDNIKNSHRTKPTRKAAENFVKGKYAPSMQIENGIIKTDINCCE